MRTSAEIKVGVVCVDVSITVVVDAITDLEPAIGLRALTPIAFSALRQVPIDVHETFVTRDTTRRVRACCDSILRLCVARESC